MDFITQGTEYSYLRTVGTITVGINKKWNISVVKVNFKGWYEAAIRLWPKDNGQRENILILQRTPVLSPNISSLDSSSGNDTVF